MDVYDLMDEALTSACAMLEPHFSKKPKSKKARKQVKAPVRVYNCADGPIDPRHGLHPDKTLRPSHEVAGVVLCRVGTHKGIRQVLVYKPGTARFSGDQRDQWGGT